jgi:hypothetical protein
MQGISVTLSGSRTATTTTAADGSYRFDGLPVGGSYTVKPTLFGYVFSPVSRSFNNLNADQYAGFVGGYVEHRITGRVAQSGGAPVSGVTVSLAGSKTATTTTGSNGGYAFDVPSGGDYTVTASKAHFTITPQTQTFTNISADKTADFSATLLRHTVSGRVTKTDGSPLAGALVALTGSQVSTATTDAQGNFSFANLAGGGDYTVTASLRHYTFAPASKEFRDLDSDQSAPFGGTLDTHTISGRATKADGSPLAGVTLALTGSKLATTTTDAAGNYSFPSLDGGGSYTLTAAKANYTFAPTSRTFDDLSSNQTADFVASLVNYRIGGRITENGSGLGGVTVALTGSQSASATTADDGSYSLTVQAEGDYTVTAAKTRYAFTPRSQTFEDLGGDKTADFAAAFKQVVEFGAAALSVGEGGGTLEVTVTRTGDTSEEVSTIYEVESGTAVRGSDVVGSTGRVTFAPGETTKTFTLFITDDTHVEGAENFSVLLIPEGEAVAGERASVAVTINDNDTDPMAANAIDDAEFFVRQHYRDFLGREPDAAGLAFWTSQITSCGADAGCRDVKRINVSAAFFLSIEFQETGFFVYKTYRAAYGQTPDRLGEFTLDAHDVSAGVVVGETGWAQKLELNKAGYVADFIARDEFEEVHPLSLTPAQFVSALDANAGNSLTPAEREAAVAEFGGAQDTSNLTARARVLRVVVDNAAFHMRETNPAFVLMQYFGYMRREPDESGFDFWLKKLEDFGGDFRRAEMVKAFISSSEYRGRFGQP